MKTKKLTVKEIAKRKTRRATARDVLQLLAAKKVKAESGTYCMTTADADTAVITALGLKEAIGVPKFKCAACALGALMVGFVFRHNNLHFTPDGYMRSDTTNQLVDAFGYEQLEQIESAFEMLTMGDNCTDAISFGKRYRSDDGRLKAICNNIIKYGEFRPEAELKSKTKA